jgi:hypothetical protein
MKVSRFATYVAVAAIGLAIMISWPVWEWKGLVLMSVAIGIIAWVSSITIAAYAIVFPGIKAGGAEFSQRVLAVTMARLFFSIGVILAIYFAFPEEVIFTVLTYFFCYALGTAFEIVVILSSLRKISK